MVKNGKKKKTKVEKHVFDNFSQMINNIKINPCLVFSQKLVLEHDEPLRYAEEV